MLLSACSVPTSAQDPRSSAYSADEPDCDNPQTGQLTVDADERGFTEVSLQVCFDARREVELRQKLEVSIGCPLNQSEFSLYKYGKIDGLEVKCELPLPRKGLQHSGRIELTPIQNVLKDAGVTGLTLNLWVPLFGAAGCDPVGQESSLPNGRECAYAFTGIPDEPSEVRFSFGYDAALLARIASILGMLLLIPITFTLWFRRRALNAAEESKPGIVFAYRRFITGTVWGGILIWWTATDLVHADGFVAFLLAPANLKDEVMVEVLPWILVWLPPVIVYFLCLALSSPIHSLRGMTRTQGEAVSQSFWAVARFAIPFSLAVLGWTELFNSPRIGVLLLLAAMFMGRYINQKAAKSYGMELQALTAGELRDRAFSIAQKAGAKLNQVYVLPAERMRMANAFAHSANNIFLTDYLLHNLSKREVDAIVGHEIAHLQKKHIRNRILILIVAVLAIIFVTFWTERWIPPNLPLGPMLYGVFLLGMFFISRRNEFAADAGAVKLTGDAEAMITGLARVTRLNTMPINWGKLDEKMLTHPSTLRRIAQLARAGGIPEEHVPELLGQAAAPPTDVYSIPATALLTGKIFSTQYKIRRSWVSSWAMMLATAMIPAAVALAIQQAQPSGPLRSLEYIAGVFLTITIYLTLQNFLPMRGAQKLETGLREKLEKESAPLAIRSGLVVGLTPDSSPRIYEGQWSWDIGLLAVSNDEMFYWGEETRFKLRREQITRISLGPGPLGWFDTPAVYVVWHDAGGNEGVFTLLVSQSGSMLKIARLTRQLAGELENWHRGIRRAAGSLLSSGRADDCAENTLGSPAFGKVTSLSPRALARGRQLVRIFVFDFFLALGVAIVFGLRFPLFDEIAPSSGTPGLNASGGAVLYVLATVGITRALVLWPFWRFREGAAKPQSAVPSPSAQQL